MLSGLGTFGLTLGLKGSGLEIFALTTSLEFYIALDTACGQR